MCHTNVIGRQCNECISGYWNINESCVYQCNCSLNGSMIVDDCNKVCIVHDINIYIQCIQSSGQCMCKEGYTGVMCTLCDDGYWMNSDELCVGK